MGTHTGCCNFPPATHASTGGGRRLIGAGKRRCPTLCRRRRWGMALTVCVWEDSRTGMRWSNSLGCRISPQSCFMPAVERWPIAVPP